MIISDICGNFEGYPHMLDSMIRVAEAVGVDKIKFQAYRMDKLHPTWEDKRDYYKKTELGYARIMDIAEKCDKALFTVWDSETAKFISKSCDTIKIASSDANNWELIRTCLDNFKNVIISTGMHSTHEIANLRRFVGNNANLLYCVSKYPALYEDVDFDRMLMFDGFSDHTPDIRASIQAIDNGIGIIERHFTLYRGLTGNDQPISSTPQEFEKLVKHQGYVNKCGSYKIRWRG